jgi:hypothetical protein
MMTALPDAALTYAARLILVFPCLPRSKEPAIARGCYAATSNPETVRRFWRVPDRNIAIPTGAVSGVWALDIDGDAGAANLLALEAQHGTLPATWQSVTGKGRHLWFKYTGPISNSAGRVATAIDVRGDGGYVIVPPSVHPSGRVYAWITPPDGEPAIAPAWLLELARKRPVAPSEYSENGTPLTGDRFRTIPKPTNGYGAAALDRECAALADVGPGARNHALNRASFRLHQLVAGGELDQRHAVDRLIEACHRNGLVKDDGLQSVVATIRSGARAGLQYPRSRSGAV